MKLCEGDWVRTDKGHIGKIINIAGLSAFVDLDPNSLKQKPESIRSHLLSELTRIDPPDCSGPTERPV